MCDPSALISSVAHIVTRFEPAPSHKHRRRGEHLHVNSGLRNDGSGGAFLDSGYGLKTFVFLGTMFPAQGGQFILALFQLSVKAVYNLKQLCDDRDVGFGKCGGQRRNYRFLAVLVDGAAMYEPHEFRWICLSLCDGSYNGLIALAGGTRDIIAQAEAASSLLQL